MPTPPSDAFPLATRLRTLANNPPTVLVIGDVMLDRYLHGSVDRVSPEAPVPVLHRDRESVVPGGAANVAASLLALGLRVRLAGITGADADRDALRTALAHNHLCMRALHAVPSRPTTVKTRVLSGPQQLLRIDAETARPLPSAHAAALADAIQGAWTDDVNALVLSDYAKGVLTPTLCRSLLRTARERGVPVFVDPKNPADARFRGATVLTPNRAEFAAATGRPSADAFPAAASALRDEMAVDILLVTRGRNGITMATADGVRDVPTVPQEVFDVSGAGDAVLAALVAARLAGAPWLDAVRAANVAGGQAVAAPGTAPIDTSRFLDALPGGGAPDSDGTATDWTRIESARHRGARIVFTNGCFDLLHAGHVRLLDAARRLGDLLVVGLNDDASVRRLKGPTRPVVTLADRRRVLQSLAAVDAVLPFSEDTPARLINRVRPDVLVKGGDYTRDAVVGADAVEARGGSVVLLPYVPGYSTTGLLESMASGNVPSDAA